MGNSGMINEDKMKDLKVFGTHEIDDVMKSVSVTMEETAKAIDRLRENFSSMRNNVEILVDRVETLRDIINDLEEDE